MLLLLYKENETAASADHPLWVFSMNGDDLAQVPSHPPRQTALVNKLDVLARPAGTRLQCFHVPPPPI